MAKPKLDALTRELARACELALYELKHLGAEETDEVSQEKRDSPACNAIREVLKKVKGDRHG